MEQISLPTDAFAFEKSGGRDIQYRRRQRSGKMRQHARHFRGSPLARADAHVEDGALMDGLFPPVRKAYTFMLRRDAMLPLSHTHHARMPGLQASISSLIYIIFSAAVENLGMR